MAVQNSAIAVVAEATMLLKNSSIAFTVSLS
jgi:hypothetical protein